MATPVLHLAASDLQDKINPMGHAGYFVVGSAAGQVPTARADAVLAQQEGVALSSLPEKYRSRTRRIDGLIAVRYAAGGETYFTMPVPTASNIQVFKNYPGRFGHGMLNFYGAPPLPLRSNTGSGLELRQVPYSARTAADALPSTAWSYSSQDNKVTLVTALVEGEHIIVDFDHDGMAACSELVWVVLTLAAVEMLREFPALSDNVSDKIAGWSTDAQLFLRRMWNAEGGYKTGIDFLDKLQLVDEYETRISGGTRRTGALGESMLL